MTSIILTRGSKWSQAELDGWGADTSDEQATELSDLVRIRFHALAAEAGCGAYWTPQTSEVVGTTEDDVTTEQLEAWRDQATQEVWEAVLGESDDDELMRKVEAIFIGDQWD